MWVGSVILWCRGFIKWWADIFHSFWGCLFPIIRAIQIQIGWTESVFCNIPPGIQLVKSTKSTKSRFLTHRIYARYAQLCAQGNGTSCYGARITFGQWVGAQHEDIREGPTLSLGHNTYTIYNIFVTTLIQLLEIFNQYNNTHVTQQYKTFTQTLQNIGTIMIFNILQ